MKFDDQGRALISPQDIAGRVRSRGDRAKLAHDILFPSTPHVFESYRRYRDFLALIADGLSVHPSNISVRGSSKFGFSTSPRSAKVWVRMHESSDIDLAVVDSDLFHLLDNEFRKWERTVDPAVFSKHYTQSRKLAENRQSHYFRDENLIPTNWVKEYRAVMKRAAEFLGPPYTQDDVTAFFYRDWWSLQVKQEKDLADLLSGIERNLPDAGEAPRPRPIPLKDADLLALDNEDLCLSEMEEITDAGLSHLKGMSKLERLWLDDLDITDAGLEHLAGLVQLKRLSVDLLRNQSAGGKGSVTDIGLAYLAGLQNLERLHIASYGITDTGLEHVKALRSLRRLSIASDGITNAGINRLQHEMRGVEIRCRRLDRGKRRDR